MKILKHLKTILKHKWYVFVAMCQCGHPIRGALHDLSKFSPAEFWESVKYFQGWRSPINAAKEDKGYSIAWFHHRGRNPHHSQYWCDISFGEVIPCQIPEKYLIELVCDTIGAGKAYLGSDWSNSSPLVYFNDVDSKSFYHDKTREALIKVYTDIQSYGWSKVALRIRNHEEWW